MRVFYDVDTQHDFMDEDGALYVPGAEGIKPALEKLTAYAKDNGVPVIGSVDRHFGTEAYREREGELSRWDGPFPDHCMDGTYGVEKISETKPDDQYILIENPLDGAADQHTIDDAAAAPTEGVAVYVEKQTFDVFSNPSMAGLLKRAGIDEAVVYGVATDYCVKDAVMGMQRRGVQCYVVEDAVSGIDGETVSSAYREMHDVGARFVRLDDIVGV